MKKNTKRCLCLLLSLVLSLSMVTTAFADTAKLNKAKKDILVDKIESYQGRAKYPSTGPIITRENPPENWQYGGSTSYNQTIRDITVNVIASYLASWMGGTVLSWKATAQAALIGYTTAQISQTLYAKKSVYYKLNTNNNGYPYYVQEIVEVWIDPAQGTHAYTTVKYFYSYQPY